MLPFLSYFTYADFLAFQDVLVQLPGICNLIRGACDIKKGPVSPDDFKVANRVIGLGGKLSRRQVDIIFQLFDLNRDGYVSPEEVASVVGLDFVKRLEAVKGREGKLTFAPPPDFSDAVTVDDVIVAREEKTITEHFVSFLKNFGLAGIAGGIGATAVYPIDLVKTPTRMCFVARSGHRLVSLDCSLVSSGKDSYAESKNMIRRKVNVSLRFVVHITKPPSF